MANLDELATWVEPMLLAMTPAERKKLAIELARKLRASQSTRIKKQQSPDGTPYEPRKPQKRGFVKEKLAMFRELQKPKHLKLQASPESAFVGFMSRAAKIAYVHQLGQVDKVEANGPSVKYAQRELLGFSESDLDLVEHVLVEHFSK